MSQLRRNYRNYHVIRAPKGRKIEVYMTPREAIKFFCMECVGFEVKVDGKDAIKTCTDTLCPLYPFRGKPKGFKKKYGFDNRRRKIEDVDDADSE